MKEKTIILKGRYSFKQNDEPYTQEAFNVYQYDEDHHYIFTSETLSRTESGQLLKVKTLTETNPDLSLYNVIVERVMGEKKSFETWDLTSSDRQIRYQFKMGEFEKCHAFYPPNRFQIASPSFAASLLMTATSTNMSYQRTPFAVLKTDNAWEFVNLPYEEPIFMEKHTIKTAKESLSPHQAPYFYKIFTGESSDEEQNEFVLYQPTEYLTIPLKADFGEGIKVDLVEFSPPKQGPTLKDVFGDS